MEATGATRSAGGEGAVITIGGGETCLDAEEGARVLGTEEFGTDSTRGGGVSGSTGAEGVENSKAGGADLARGGEGLGLAEKGGLIMHAGGEVVKRSTVAAGRAMDSPAGVDTTPVDSAKGVGGAGEDTVLVTGGGGGSFADSGTGGGRGSNGGDIGTRAGKGSTKGGEEGGVLEGDWVFEGSEGSFMRFMTFSDS